MKVNYWDCKSIGNFEWSDEGYHLYGCDHPENTEFTFCPLNNKYGEDTAYCPFLDNSLTPDEARLNFSSMDWNK